MSELHSPGIVDCWVPPKPWCLKTPIEKETAKKLAAERLHQTHRSRRIVGISTPSDRVRVPDGGPLPDN